MISYNSSGKTMDWWFVMSAKNILSEKKVKEPITLRGLLTGFIYKPDKPDGWLKTILSLYMLICCFGLLISDIWYKIIIGIIGLAFFGMHIFWKVYIFLEKKWK